MHISKAGLAFIEGFEGFSSTPYFDRLGGVWTRGYGETEGISRSSPAISRAFGERNLEHRLERFYEPSIRALGIALNQNQWDALCSFAWNLGAGIFTGSLRAALQAHDWSGAAQHMLAYDHAGGAVVLGLRRRREAEAALFLRAPAAYVPADEARWIRAYDELRGRRSAWALMRRRVLRRYMLRRRVLIWDLAQAQENGWKRLNRKARYDALLARTR